jgi:CRISPR-associated endonuclease/helicase Cas3
MKIETLPVYTKLANKEDIPSLIKDSLPSRIQLYQHQLETYLALTESDSGVIFNTAITGDGKSLAGQLPVLLNGWESPLFAMYPTNELARDQRSQITKAQDEWVIELEVGTLNSTILDEIMLVGDYSQRGEALMSRLRNNDVILTNPDIFHLVMQQFYVRPKDAPDKIIGPMIDRFRQFTFDEFHIFNTPQVISVLNALLFIHEISAGSYPHKFLFLSATPGELMLKYLERSGLRVKEIKGNYSHTTSPSDDEKWRRILQGTEVYFSSERVETWVEEHLENTLLPFFTQRTPHAKGAIIVNSVASAHRLLEKIRPKFAEHNLIVMPNTGLTSQEKRERSYEADLLIGTSTVDVGVDFQINFLLFESRDAGSFLQRLGRLGRHEHYFRDDKKYQFEDFVAYALVPPWIEEALFKKQKDVDPLLAGGGIIDREQLNEAIEKAYPPTATFDNYVHLWGKYQSTRVIYALGNPTVREQYSETRKHLGKRYEETFSIQLRPTFGHYKRLHNQQRKLLDEAISFRGGSYFTCCIIDESEEGVARFKTTDLLQMTANAKLAWLDEDEFYTAVETAGMRRHTFERHEPLAFFLMYGWLDERRDYRMYLDRDISDWDASRFGKAGLFKGWHLSGQMPGLNTLNNRLSRRQLPALLCLGYHPLELKRMLRLPLLFAIYQFESRDGVEGCVVFGREALLLEARLWHSNLDCGGGAAFIF